MSDSVLNSSIEWQPAKVGVYLKEGDTIKTGDSTSLVILYQSGRAKQIKSNEQFVVSSLNEETTLLSQVTDAICNFLFGKKFPLLVISAYSDRIFWSAFLSSISSSFTINLSKGSVSFTITPYILYDFIVVSI